ncbi:general secretion pathway protein GspB [Parasalinivibrio latis]|uniref:general secretion pathway protein GspB n=1 Tax=Parasalinivibrio latis TaxID=2952610 RepID=UPI0030DF6B7D
MSRLFADLTSSPDASGQTKYTKQPAALGMGASGAAPSRLRRWPWVVAAVVFPSIVAGGVYYYLNPPVVPVSPVTAPIATTVVLETEAPETESAKVIPEPESASEPVVDYRILPYPAFNVKPLPAGPEVQQTADGDSADPAELLSSMLKQGQESQRDEAGSKELGLDAINLETLPPELALKLKEALSDDKSRTAEAKLARNQARVIPFGDLPADAQQRFPKLDFQAHLYGSEQSARWVKVNGREVREGQEIVPGVLLLGIEPNQVVLQFEDWLVALPALATVG